jgi:putative tryptophan/tyrosine transport system substrate-binding protein
VCGLSPINAAEDLLMIKRREFIAGLGGAVAWPLATRAQQPEVVRRIGVLAGDLAENDPTGIAYVSAFTRALQQLGWIDGRNVRIDVRWAASDVELMRRSAKELVDLQPDVIVSASTPATAAVKRETRTIPVVFVVVTDPIGEGFTVSLAHPGGNLTGFTNSESSIAGKWLQLLTEIAPSVRRVAMLFNPATAPRGGSYLLPMFEAAARAFNVEPIIAPVRSDDEIASVITSLGREPKGGFVLQQDAFVMARRAPIIALAAQNNVPAVYPYLPFPRDGGLLSYGTDFEDIWRRAAPYVDRILRGSKPEDLPVQLPIKFFMGLNVKTAKALGLDIPPQLLARADEVIE